MKRLLVMVITVVAITGCNRELQVNETAADATAGRQTLIKKGRAGLVEFKMGRQPVQD